jgi:hypothetical protein
MKNRGDVSWFSRAGGELRKLTLFFLVARGRQEGPHGSGMPEHHSLLGGDDGRPLRRVDSTPEPVLAASARPRKVPPMRRRL